MSGHHAIGGHQSANSGTTTWLTPRPIIWALGGPESFDLDPCAAPARMEDLMSWSFDFVAEDAPAAKAKLAEYASAIGIHFPEPVASMIAGAIDCQPEGQRITVESNGHLGGTGLQTVSISVRSDPAPG